MIGLFVKTLYTALSLAYFRQNLLLTARLTRRISFATTRKFAWPTSQLICLPNTDSSFAVFSHLLHPTTAWQIWYMRLSTHRDGLSLDRQLPTDRVESLGDNAPISEAPTEGGIRDNASLSLEPFRCTGDRRQATAYGRKRTHADSVTPSVARACLCGIGQRVGYRSQTRHRRAREDEDTGGVMHAIAAARRGLSPASLAWSRQSATGTSSRLQSPTQQSLTRGSAPRSDEPPDMERSSVSNRQPGKRKASTVSSDFDIEMINTPALKKAKVNAKPPSGEQRPSRKK